MIGVFYKIVVQGLQVYIPDVSGVHDPLSGCGEMRTDSKVVNRDEMFKDSLSDRLLRVKWKFQAVLPSVSWVDMDT